MKIGVLGTGIVCGAINGAIVMLIGVWLLLNSLGIVRVGFWEMFWPLILVGIGSMLVLQSMRRRTREVSGDRDNTMNAFAVLSGIISSALAALAMTLRGAAQAQEPSGAGSRE